MKYSSGTTTSPIVSGYYSQARTVATSSRFRTDDGTCRQHVACQRTAAIRRVLPQRENSSASFLCLHLYDSNRSILTCACVL